MGEAFFNRMRERLAKIDERLEEIREANELERKRMEKKGVVLPGKEAVGEELPGGLGHGGAGWGVSSEGGCHEVGSLESGSPTPDLEKSAVRQDVGSPEGAGSTEVFIQVEENSEVDYDDYDEEEDEDVDGDDDGFWNLTSKDGVEIQFEMEELRDECEDDEEEKWRREDYENTFKYDGHSRSVEWFMRNIDKMRKKWSKRKKGRLKVIELKKEEDGRLMADSRNMKFWGLLGEFALLPRKTGREEEKQYFDPSSTKLLRVEKGQAESIEVESLTRELLETSTCYLLNCSIKVIVWMEKINSLDDRKSASTAAEGLVSGPDRFHYLVIRIVEGYETFIFRSKLDLWPEITQVTVSEGRGKVAALLKRQGVWRVNDEDKEECLIRTWFGKQSVEEERTSAIDQSSKMDKSFKFLPVQVGIYEGKEHIQFFFIFQSFIIFKGGIGDGYKNFIAEMKIQDETYKEGGIAQYRVRGYRPGNIQAIRELAERQLDLIKSNALFKTQEEGRKLKQFWEFLGDNSEYSSHKDDLMTEDIYTSDWHTTIFVWVYQQADANSRLHALKIGEKFAVCDFLLQKLSSNAPINVIMEGSKSFFTCFFSLDSAKSAMKLRLIALDVPGALPAFPALCVTSSGVPVAIFACKMVKRGPRTATMIQVPRSVGSAAEMTCGYAYESAQRYIHDTLEDKCVLRGVN